MMEWKTRGNFDCTQQQIANQKKYILYKNLLTEAEPRTILDQIQQDSSNEDSEEPPTANDDPDPDQAAVDPEQAAEGPEQVKDTDDGEDAEPAPDLTCPDPKSRRIRITLREIDGTKTVP